MSKFQVRDVEYTDADDWTEVSGHSSDDAAERYAERHDGEGEYRDGDGRIIEVKDAAGRLTRWRVWGMMTVRYHSRQVDTEASNV